LDVLENAAVHSPLEVVSEIAREIDESIALPRKSRLSASAYHLPEHVRTIADIEEKIKASSPAGVKLPYGMINRITGVERVHVMPDDWQTSDLAAAAARNLFSETGIHPSDIDMLIFASASQDMIEPATSHIVSAKLGVNAPVMDVKNACNSMLNGIQVADAMVQTGAYQRALVVSGEAPSRGIRWNIPDKDTYMSSFPGFTMSDAGAAVLIESTDIPQTGRSQDLPRAEIIGMGFSADSSAWDVGMLPHGGSVNPRGFDRTYFEIDGGRLFKAFTALGSSVLTETVNKLGYAWDEFAMIGVHQVALPYLDQVRETLGVPGDRTVITLGDHGNVASCTLPLQLKIAERSGMVQPGDLIALVGLAGGISLGVTVVRL
jgi:3-oxoacyl-[acyl-carrier-protein] synthase-3